MKLNQRNIILDEYHPSQLYPVINIHLLWHWMVTNSIFGMHKQFLQLRNCLRKIFLATGHPDTFSKKMELFNS